ncbi:MAG: cell division protein FtsL [Azoarcus sp.]|jgi:cell division protein FtsL|nr:cell division protein FtsL [Azoarcus sp.]
MIRGDALLVALLIALAASSAIGVISSQHEARNLRGALEREQNRAKSLEVDRRQLQLEQSTLTAPHRVEGLARKRLGMIPPQAGQIVVLEGGRP